MTPFGATETTEDRGTAAVEADELRGLLGARTPEKNLLSALSPPYKDI